MFESVKNIIGYDGAENVKMVEQEAVKELNRPELEHIATTFARNVATWEEEVHSNQLNEPSSPIGRIAHGVIQGIYREHGKELLDYILKKAGFLEDRGFRYTGGDFYGARQFLLTDENLKAIIPHLDIPSRRALLIGVQNDLALVLKYRFAGDEDTFRDRNSYALRRYYKARENLSALLPFLDEEVRVANMELLRKTDVDGQDYTNLAEAEWDKFIGEAE